ncbi:hypothetical protein FGB62_30g043 [Gracilaria domingensis]|nr:hypothetical protein FGB62_30g043 [Gracilaria domingensis]
MTQDNDQTDADACVQQTTVVGIEAPLLEKIDIASIAQFLRKRKIYEEQIIEKKKEGLKINPASWKTSVTESVLETMIEAEFVKADNIDCVTDEQIKEGLRKRSKFDQDEIRVNVWERIVKDVKMDMSIDDPEGRVFDLIVQYRNALRDQGYADAIAKNPEVAIKHIRERVRPRKFQDHMEEILLIESHSGLHKKDFGAFIRRLAKEARTFEYGTRTNKDRLHDSILPINVQSTKRKHEASDGERNTKPHREAPLCWNKSKCYGKRNFISKCPNSTEEEKKAFLKTFREQKEKSQTQKRSVKKIKTKDEEKTSPIFDALFCKGKLEDEVTADQGSSANIMPMSFYNKLKDLDGIRSMHKLARTAVYNVFNEAAAPITCNFRVSADVTLEVRHGKVLLLRNVDWLVANEPTTGIVIGRQVRNAVGLNNPVMLEAAMSRVGTDVDIPLFKGVIAFFAGHNAQSR